MATATLVNQEIEEGQRLINALNTIIGLIEC